MSRARTPATGRRALALAAAALATAAFGETPATAAESPVLEVHSGARPDDAGALLGPVAAELAAAGFAGTLATATGVEHAVSSSAALLTAAEQDALVRRIEAGYQRVVAGEFEPALAELTAGLAELRRATASVAGNDRLRGAALRALVGVALSHKRLGQGEQAEAAMGELIRSFPDREISYRDYGPEPRDLYNRVAAALRGDGAPASLTIEVDVPSTVVFLNERYVGVGRVTAADLPPGRYRVYLQQGSRRGRVHLVDVAPGAPTTTSLSWRLDAALHTDGGVAALTFDDDGARRADQGAMALRLGRELGAPTVALLGFREVAGQRHVVGQIYRVDTRREVRSATVAVDPVRDDQLRALGRYLAGDESAAALVEPLAPSPVIAPGGADDAARDDEGPWRFGGWRWATATVAAAALVGGGVLIAVHEPERLPNGDRNEAVRETRAAGIAVAAGGAALGALAVWMFVHDAGVEDPPPARRVVVEPRPGGGVVGVAGRF